MTVLAIDDEKDLLELLRYNLAKEHFDVKLATDGAQGLGVARDGGIDLVILDLMMPGMTGLDVCRKLREDPRTRNVPIIMLTAKAAETDRIIGLELGADDYVVKPFSPRELVARVRAVLRRTSAEAPAEGEREGAKVIRRGGENGIIIDIDRHEVTVAGNSVTLTATEFRILQFLAERQGRVLSRDQIIDAALGREAAVTDRTIDVHITSLRKKLGEGGEMIQTVRGFGYKFVEHQA